MSLVMQLVLNVMDPVTPDVPSVRSLLKVPQLVLSLTTMLVNQALETLCVYSHAQQAATLIPMVIILITPVRPVLLDVLVVLLLETASHVKIMDTRSTKPVRPLSL